MEWSDIYKSASNPSLFSSVAPQFGGDDGHHDHQPVDHWTFEENKLFENALAKFGLDSPSFFDHVASRLPHKSTDQIKKHYRCLLEDVEMIEAGVFPMPKYVSSPPHEEESSDQGGVEEMMSKIEKIGSSSSSSSKQVARKTCSGLQRKRGVPWTEEEHQLFLMGLNKYGKGDWRSISRYYVVTKTSTQVASHAQKFFRRQTTTTPPERRRSSIHDIQTVNSTFFSIPHQRNKNPTVMSSELLMPPHQVRISTPYVPNIPIYNNHKFNNDDQVLMTNFGKEISPVFPPGTSANQPSGAYPSSSYPIPYPRNYP